MPTVHEHYGSGGSYSVATGFLASLECEIEDLKTNIKTEGPVSPYFKAVQDGSLRNKGIEFCSTVPQDRVSLMASFKSLHALLKLGPNPFSERTSTHVHVNVSNMEMRDARKMVLLYALFEEFFFAMVKPNRRDNIHCVPLTETYLPEKYREEMQILEGHWHKYTALNLKRMRDLGTMEFRHMHGTGDAQELDVWVNVLENLYKLAPRVEMDTKSLSSQKTVMEWFESIFFPSDNVMKLRPSLYDIIRNSLIDVKLSTL